MIAKLYEAGSIPLPLAARVLGSDPVDTLIGLSSSGHTIRICQGTHDERERAFAAIAANEGKGCVVDAVTLHVIRRLNVGDAVASVCGPIGIVDQTMLRLQQKIHELNDRIDQTDMSLAWRDGHVYRSEVTPDQKREALALLESDQRWLAERAVTLPAEGLRDPSRDMRQLMKHFGSSFADELRAAQGSSRLLVCEDHGMRILAQDEFGVPATWLQPVLMRAREAGAITHDNYRKAVLAFVDTRFEFVSIDASLLLGCVEGLASVSLPADFLKLVSRLGGKKADLLSHTNVALETIRQTWSRRSLPWTAREAIVGALLENLWKDRPIDHVMMLLRTFMQFGQTVIAHPEFLQYLHDWMRGHFLPTELA
jgi:hypothetical protein